MKRRALLYILAGLCLAFTACATEKLTIDREMADQMYVNAFSADDADATDIRQEILDEFMKMAKPSDFAGVSEVVQLEHARLRPGSGMQTVALIEKNIDLEHPEYSQAYLCIVEEGKYLFEPVNRGSYSVDMWLRDMDGDGISEIILQSVVGMTGGAGYQESKIFKLGDDGLSIWWEGPRESRFILTLEPDFVYTVGHADLDYSYSFVNDALKQEAAAYDKEGNLIDRTDKSRPSFFEHPFYNADGSLTGQWKNGSPFGADTFYYLEPMDVDGDGVFELLTGQYTSLFGHSDYIGTAYSLWALGEDGRLEPVKVGFWSNVSEGSGALREYEESWYK